MLPALLTLASVTCDLLGRGGEGVGEVWRGVGSLDGFGALWALRGVRGVQVV